MSSPIRTRLQALVPRVLLRTFTPKVELGVLDYVSVTIVEAF